MHTTLLEKYPTFFIFAKTFTFIRMRDFFPRLSVASVDGKQHLNKEVFSALVGFSL